MAKLNFSRAAISSKPSDCASPRSKQPSASWYDPKTKRQRQIEEWRRARQCLKEAGALDER